jgi:hypothetical protein
MNLAWLQQVLGRIPYTPFSLRRRSRDLLAAGKTDEASEVAEKLFRMDPRRGIQMRGEILQFLKPKDDHSGYWLEALERYPREIDFVRKATHAALRVGNLRVAEDSLARLIERKHTRYRDANFVVGLANIYGERGESAKVRGVVRRFLRSLRGKAVCRIASVRLSRLIFAWFPSAKARNRHLPKRDLDERMLSMIARSAVRPKSKALLDRVLKLQQSLAARSPCTFFDTDISEEQTLEFIALALQHLNSGKAFSFVRLGDGESSCIPYEQRLSSFELTDSIAREKMWWGRALTESERTKYSRAVSEAIWNADCIGIPTISRFLRDINLSGNDGLENGRTGRGLRAVLNALEQVDRVLPDPLRSPYFASCHLHQDISRWQLYPELFKSRPDVVLVSCHRALESRLAEEFSIRIEENIVIPPRFASIPVFEDAGPVANPLPDILENVAEVLAKSARGRLVLVGAGYLGKSLIHLAKTQGAVALDVGSIFDRWVGANTRSYLDLAAE